MFTTHPIVQQLENNECKDSGNVVYRCGHVTDHQPFLIVTFSKYAEQDITVFSTLTSDLKIISNFTRNEKLLKIERIQLMAPEENVVNGWQLHKVVTIRTLSIKEEKYDEYLTTDGRSFTFASGGLSCSVNSNNAIYTHYEQHEHSIRHANPDTKD